MTTFFMTLALFGGCFVALSIGLLVRGMVLRSSCGGVGQSLGEEASCGACSKKEADMCPSDDESGLLNIAQISNPGKTAKERPKPPSMDV